MATPEQLRQIGAWIIHDEARRDRNGHLAIYDIPSGDGGGTREVAGINNRYHPDEYQVLAELVHDKEWDEAERYAAKYMVSYTDVVSSWGSLDPGVEYFLRDSVFNRGPSGAARILQMALGVTVDGKVGPITRGKLATAQPDELIAELRKARERYERVFAHRNESSKFWKGLVDRWAKVTARATALHSATSTV